MFKVLTSAIALITTITIPGLSVSATAATKAPVLIGLNADMSGASALSGEAIRRGALLAIAEINAGGGVLGRRIELVVKDHRGIPARGNDNILDFATIKNLVAVVGGIHSPVASPSSKVSTSTG